jgi:2-desacetyl-2-hydroxyethyl bacteriochlorophyllide A dehydrogenase
MICEGRVPALRLHPPNCPRTEDHVQEIEALVCQQPGQLIVARRSAPRPALGEALVRPLRVGLCGTDYHIFEGTHPFLQYPRVPGHELAVEVLEAPSLSGLRAGQICVVNPYLSCGHCVACRAGKPNCCVNIAVLGVHRDGGMAELLCVPASNLITAEGLSTDECATVEFLAIGAHAVRRGQVTDRDRVLVVGTGPIGLGTSLFARLSGASVAVYDRDAERSAGATSIVGVEAVAPAEDVALAVAEFSDGEGFDVVFDATGNSQAMEKGFELVAPGGRYVLVSVVKGQITFTDSDFHRKEMSLLGSRNATAVDFERVMTSIRGGLVPTDRLVTHRTTLQAAVTNIPIWATQKHGLIKALITLD